MQDSVALQIHDDFESVMAARPSQVFFFYLRAFKNDTHTTESWKSIDEEGREVGTSQGSPKEALKLLLQAAGPLIELGGKHDSGLGRIKVADQDWRTSANALIIHSTANFLNPGLLNPDLLNPDSGKGLTEETELILKHHKLLRRTFLIMEPTHQTMSSALWPSDWSASERKPRWNKIRGFFRAHGIDLPDYHPDGAIISLYTPERQVRFADLERFQLYALMREFFVHMKKRGSYDFAADESCPCGSGRPYTNCHPYRAASRLWRS